MELWASRDRCRISLSEFMERNQLALNVSLRICSKKTKESPFQLVKKKMGRNDDTAMPGGLLQSTDDAIGESPDDYA